MGNFADLFIQIFLKFKFCLFILFFVQFYLFFLKHIMDEIFSL